MRKSELEAAGASLISFYRDNPVIAAKELLGEDLFHIQQVILEDCWFRGQTTTVASRGFGKTRLAAIIACLYPLLYPGTRVGLLASSFRQSRFIFDQCESFYYKSPFLSAACAGPPKRNPDSYRLDFKQVGNVQQGRIEALPIGTDGAKIRGSRFTVIIVDEFAQVPEQIYTSVISPMAVTNLNPMEAVRFYEKYDALLLSNEITLEQYETILKASATLSNKIFAFSSAYFKFNHLYKRFSLQKDLIRKGSKEYAIHQINYREIPKGFLNPKIVEDARATMPDIMFGMEYEAIFGSDSDGVFKASLIEARKNGINNGRMDLTVKLRGDSDKQYVIGIDPARDHDYFAIVIIELGNPNQVVFCQQFRGKEFPDAANIVFDLVVNRFNVVALYMDKFGGARAIADILATKTPAILEVEDESSRFGKRIIQLITPTNTSTHEAVNDTKSLLEQGKLWFPSSPGMIRFEASESSIEEENIFDTVNMLIKQLLLVIPKPTQSGQIHYTVPGDSKSRDGIKKDLFSAFILAGKACFDRTERPVLDNTPILLHYGIIKDRTDVRWFDAF